MYMQLEIYKFLYSIFFVIGLSARLSSENIKELFFNEFITLYTTNISYLPPPDRLLSSSLLILNAKDLELLLKNGPASDYQSTIICPLDNTEEALQVLTELSSHMNFEQTKNETVKKIMNHVQILLTVPKNNGNESYEKLGAETIFLETLVSQVFAEFDLTTSILFAYYSLPTETNISAENIASKIHLAKFDIWELYSVKNVPFLKQVGTALEGSYLAAFLQFETRRVSRRHDWQGIEIQAATFMASAVVDEDNGSFIEIDGITKFEVNLSRNQTNGELVLKSSLSARIFWDLEMALNFTGKVLQPYEYTSGFENVVSKYGHTFDIIISHFTVVPQKLKFAQHLEPSYFNGISALFVQPPAHAFRNIYTAPFTFVMWQMIVATWIVIGLSFHIIRWIRSLSIFSVYYDDDNAFQVEKDEQVACDCFWWAIAASCQQGWYVTPNTTPSRIVFATGLFFSLLCYAAYTATIVSELWNTIIPITNLETLFENSKEVYVELNSDVASIVVEGLLERNSEFLSKIRMRKTTGKLFHHLLHGGRGKSCFLNWPEYFIDDAKQFLASSQQWRHRKSVNVEVEFCEKFSIFLYKYIPVKAAMYVHKGSPFFKIFNFRILKAKEVGLLSRYWNEYLRSTGIRCLFNSNQTHALGIHDTYMLFAILLSGYTVSLFLLLLELIFYKRKQFNKVFFKRLSTKLLQFNTIKHQPTT